MNRFLKVSLLCLTVALMAGAPAAAQKNTKKANQKAPAAQPQTQQRTQRVDPTVGIKEVLDRIYNYLNGCTPAEVVDADGKTITDLSKIDEKSSFKKGDFGINTYEWGVTYSGFMLASDVTGDEKYADYAYERLKLIGQVYPHIKNYYDATGYSMRLGAINTPKWLDDCGSMDAAMIKATLRDPQRSKDFRGVLDNWFDFAMYQEYRLGDGILARNRPTTNSVWLDDMYMGITPIAYRGKLSQSERGDLTQKFYNEAVNQVLLFKKYLWVPEKNIFRHGWIEGMSIHPDYHWARCNGWAMLTLCDVLDAIPERTQGRDQVLELLQQLISGVTAYQAPDGRWHQLLDKTESYLETSATAIFAYCIAHAVNQGWVDKTAYQDVAKSAWNGIAPQVNALGQVENTCVGTGLGWTNTFYANRPVSVFAAHGYGPVILAAAELIKLYENDRNRPAAPNFYANNSPMTKREEGKPVLFLCGDSTCTSAGGPQGPFGWGRFFQEYVDGITVDNRAISGLSSRTFFNGTWAGFRDQIKEGDYVIIQFGHNDTSPLGTGRARGSVSGTGDEPQKVTMEKNGANVDVYSYGHYLRMMVRQAKLRGATPIIVSPTPLNSWVNDNKVARYTGNANGKANFNDWSREVAAQEGVAFIDLNELAGQQYDKIGREAAQKDYFNDSVHTKEMGARLYCTVLSKALKSAGLPISKYVR